MSYSSEVRHFVKSTAPGLALYTVGDSEIDHLWGGRSGEGSMMLKDPKLPNDPED